MYTAKVSQQTPFHIKNEKTALMGIVYFNYILSEVADKNVIVLKMRPG